MREKTIIAAAPADERAAALLVQTAGRFKSRLEIQADNKTINAKSIMGVLVLNLKHGQQATIRAEGEDADEAIEALAGLLDIGAAGR